jgi:hypothetical protein
VSYHSLLGETITTYTIGISGDVKDEGIKYLGKGTESNTECFLTSLIQRHVNIGLREKSREPHSSLHRTSGRVSKPRGGNWFGVFCKNTGVVGEE